MNLRVVWWMSDDTPTPTPSTSDPMTTQIVLDVQVGEHLGYIPNAQQLKSMVVEVLRETLEDEAVLLVLHDCAADSNLVDVRVTIPDQSVT